MERVEAARVKTREMMWVRYSQKIYDVPEEYAEMMQFDQAIGLVHPDALVKLDAMEIALDRQHFYSVVRHRDGADLYERTASVYEGVGAIRGRWTWCSCCEEWRVAFAVEGLGRHEVSCRAR